MVEIHFPRPPWEGRIKRGYYCCTPPLQFPLFLIRNSNFRFFETHFLVHKPFLSKKGYNNQNFLRASRESEKQTFSKQKGVQ